ncbi:MAG: ABC transporter permease [Selenomonadaceae bacterium]|nr:ABC transporter permease [Selenomonadaceae bacterium]
MLKIMRRELDLLIHERLAVLIILLFAATAYSLLIGNLYRGGIVQKIPVAVCDLEDSPLSRELIRATAEADQFNFCGTVSDDAEAVKLLERGEIAAALIIPNDFSEKFYCSESVTLAFLQDGSNTLQAGYASAPMQSICAAFSAEFNQRAATANSTPEISPAPVTLSLRLPANPTQSYLAFYMYGVMLMAAQIGMIMGFSMSIHEDFRAGFFRQGILLALVSKIIFYLALSLLSVALGIFFLTTFGNLPFRGDFGNMILICAAFLFAVEGLAGLAGIYFKTKLALVQAMVFYTLPAFLLSGYIWPEVGMTEIIRWVSMLQPVHYVLTDFRILSLTGVAPQINQHAAVLFAIGSVSFVLLYGFLFFDERPSVTSEIF